MCVMFFILIFFYVYFMFVCFDSFICTFVLYFISVYPHCMLQAKIYYPHMLPTIKWIIYDSVTSCTQFVLTCVYQLKSEIKNKKKYIF